MLTTPQQYVDSLETPARAWVGEFLAYMAEKYPAFPPVMFRQRPMCKIGASYLLFTAAQQHFTLHTLNFSLIEALKADLPHADYGKGCVKVKFSDVAAKPRLFALCDEVVRVNLLDSPPPVDTPPEMRYDQHLDAVFSASKACWRPLYLQLLSAAQKSLPPFTEYFPAVGILWKHPTTFASIQLTKAAMRIEFYAERLYPERNPVKHMQLSARRCAHVVEITDASAFGDVLAWLSESYALTSK